LITKGKWTSEQLEEAMDVVENGTISLRKASKQWNISLTSFFNHLYGKTRTRELGPIVILTLKEDKVVVA
jgi:hypothetical protein